MKAKKTFTAILPNGNEIQIGFVNGKPQPFIEDYDGDLSNIMPLPNVFDEQLEMTGDEFEAWAANFKVEAVCESILSLHIGRGHYRFMMLVNGERFEAIAPMPKWYDALKSDNIDDEELEDVKNSIAIHILEYWGFHYSSITIK